MKRILAALFLAALCSGCCSIKGERTVEGPDGKPVTLKISSLRWFWASEGVSASLTDINGVTFSLTVQKSSVDNAALTTVVNGLVSLSKKAP